MIVVPATNSLYHTQCPGIGLMQEKVQGELQSRTSEDRGIVIPIRTP